MKRPPVLIANRGEIVTRIARSCHVLGFPCVGVYSEADRFSDYLHLCDQSIFIGESEPKKSYLNVESILRAASISGAKLIHPGYGFLSERASFADACEKAGVIFVGPTTENMRVMGDKIEARKTVDQLKIPRVPGSAGKVKDHKEAREVASEIGFPVLLKAAAGGGGKGMRVVNQATEIESAFLSSSNEALNAFGDASLFVEKFILEPHHVEIQVFGDGKGDGVHLGERECSIQRRHQKIWEETPSPILQKFPKTREWMFDAALKIVKHIRYRGAGTLEFIVDGKGNFYFLEMNTRLQVEHPVSEWVTGVDLVAWQLLLASGEWTLPTIPERRGASIEVRVYAEHPQSFLPAPGPIGSLRIPAGPFVRWDSSFFGPSEVNRHYDPMIAKLSVWGADRKQALGRLQVALDELHIGEKDHLRTNVSFLRNLVGNSDVQGGDTTTDLIQKNPKLLEDPNSPVSIEAALALSIFQLVREDQPQIEDRESGSQWMWSARKESLRRV